MTAPALSILTPHVSEGLLAELGAEIALVEEELTRQMRSQSALVEKVAKHTLRAGGKRLRPAFVTIGAKSTGCDFDVEATRRIGACMEMIHMATLIHDDVIDNSSTRRGLPTAGYAFGNRASILTGDALLAKATILLAEEEDLELIRLVSEAVSDMAEGEVREVEVRGNFDLDEATHLEILRLKTASFIEACCESGAIVAKAEPRMRSALRRYGKHVGIAFQIVDDLLDYRGEKDKTGKPTAIDFCEGQATLPLIYLRDRLNESELQIVRSKFGTPIDEREIRMIACWMDTRGAFEQCEKQALHHVEIALEAVQELPVVAARELLATVAEYVLRRQL
ncbi:MAG TPA: polyprenyl synthetase family protein [Fimbriimonas sp.]|nr:polyprenyl synthetase family protein [Fimbriimonas sp.]